jgi:hypothetical protein
VAEGQHPRVKLNQDYEIFSLPEPGRISCDLRFVNVALTLSQVIPVWIHGSNELDLLAASPDFNLFLAIDGGGRIEKALVLNEPSQVVTAGKAFNDFVLMLPNAAREVPSDTRVQNMRTLPICHDVDVEFLRWSHARLVPLQRRKSL